jgi:hypothetical protein
LHSETKDPNFSQMQQCDKFAAKTLKLWLYAGKYLRVCCQCKRTFFAGKIQYFDMILSNSSEKKAFKN